MSFPFEKYPLGLLTNYGCEVTKLDIPKQVSWLFKQHGFNDVITVPCRKNGLTGSGKEQSCHQNVYKLVKSYGGKHLQGFNVKIAKALYENGRDKKPTHVQYGVTPDTVKLTWHSVWVTPEGNAVDVTNYKNFLYNSQDTITFIPCHLVTGEKYGVASKGTLIPFKFKLKGIWLEDENGKSIKLKTKRIDKFWAVSDISEEDRDWYMKDGGFKNPSSATGKYRDEFLKAA